MKNQACFFFFFSKDKSKKIKCRLLRFLFGALRAKTLCILNGPHELLDYFIPLIYTCISCLVWTGG